VALLLVLCLAGHSRAQGKATLIDAPLDVKLARGAAEVQRLQSDFRQLLAKHRDLLLPTRSTWKATLEQARPTDCEVRDDCLRDLALAGNVLYAIYASVELDAAGQVLFATGRVVTRDGDVARAALRVSEPVSGTLQAAAARCLRRLLEGLELNTLPATLPHLALSPVTVVEKEPELVALPTPPPIEVRGPPAAAPAGAKTLRGVAWGTGALAVLLVGTSVGFGLTAAVARGKLPADGQFTSNAQAQAQAALDTQATVALVAALGAGVFAATSALLFTASGPLTVSLAPGPRGGALVLSGGF
jgi:hypothetical protein